MPRLQKGIDFNFFYFWLLWQDFIYFYFFAIEILMMMRSLSALDFHQLALYIQ